MSKVLVTGSTGLLGSALCAELVTDGYEVVGLSSKDVDLLDFNQTINAFVAHNPDIVIHAAGSVGGILKNESIPYQLLYENTLMGLNVIHTSLHMHIKKLINVSSSCVYPSNTGQLQQPDDLFNGRPDESNMAYAAAKLVVGEACVAARKQFKVDYKTVIPCNLYGPKTSFDEKDGHVIGALIARITKAHNKGDDHVVIWGSGEAERQFLHSADAARMIAATIEMSDAYINIAPDESDIVTIKMLAFLIAQHVGFEGRLVFDADYMNGAYDKNMTEDDELLRRNVTPRIKLADGIKQLVEEYNDQIRTTAII